MLCFLAQNECLVADFFKCVICNLCLFYSVTSLDNILSVACKSYIYTLYIGDKLGEFTCDDLPEFCWDISIRGDELAVAGYNEGVFVYKII